jgi:hypothetical protein
MGESRKTCVEAGSPFAPCPRAGRTEAPAPLQREGGDDDVAPAFVRVPDRVVELRHRGVDGPVIAVAVGRLHHHHVDGRGRFGAVQKRPVLRADIAREENAPVPPVLFQFEEDAGRAEDMARVVERGAGAVPKGHGPAVVGLAPEPVEAVERVDRVVERFALLAPWRCRLRRFASSSCRWAESSSTSRVRSRVADVQMISPRNPRFTRSGMRPQWSRWAWVSNSTSTSAGSKPEIVGVLLVQFPPALEHAAIHEDAPSPAGHQMAGARDAPRPLRER